MYMTKPQLNAAMMEKGASAGGIGLGFAALVSIGGRLERGIRLVGRYSVTVDHNFE